MNSQTRRDLRRYQLALRLMAHQARTQTISAMTRLTHHQLATLRKRWRITQDMRHRGPSPTSLSVFLHSPRARAEGASLAVACRALHVLPRPGSSATRASLFSIEAGERLCEVYEAYRTCFPASDVEFEDVLLLAAGLVDGDAIRLSNCGSCGATILVDLLAMHRGRCFYCHLREVEALSTGTDKSPPSPTHPMQRHTNRTNHK